MRIKSKYTLITIQVRRRDVFLHPLKAAFLPDTQTLICSDVHIGKAAHFRNSNIPIPQLTNKGNFWRLVQLIEEFEPLRIIFLGDIIHSVENNEWDDFIDFLDQFPQIERILIKGNHDIQDDQFFSGVNFQVSYELIDGELRFVHIPDQASGSQFFTFAGHIHPAVLLRGKARQHLTLPCFWLKDNQLIMPAFGEFTGTKSVKPAKEDLIYVVAGDEVLPVS